MRCCRPLRVVDPAAAVDSDRMAAVTSDELETRAARRARREALESEPVLSPLATMPRPILATTSALLAILLSLAAASDYAILAAGLMVMFVHQLVRRDGRPRLVQSTAITAFGIAVVTIGGIAKNDAEKSLVTKLVTDIHGVKSVVNNMVVEAGTAKN